VKRKICVVVTARPSYSRIKTALEAIKNHNQLELQLVVAASALLEKYGKVVNQMKKDGFDIAGEVWNLVEGETLGTSAKTTGLGIIELTNVFEKLMPDAVVTVADRYETMATAITASYMNIPLVHIQGGEVTGNIDEKVRHAISKLSDIHFVSTQKAKERVINMGENKEKVFITGCPSIDIAKKIASESTNDISTILSKYSGVGKQLQNCNEYIIVMQHPVTTEQNMIEEQIASTYKAIKDVNVQVYWFWPNVDSGSDYVSKKLRQIREIENPENVYFFKNLTPEDFIIFLKNSKCIIGNSSVAIREASYLGVPAINVGTRQSGRERGKNVIDVNYDAKELRTALNKVLSGDIDSGCDTIYGDGEAGKNIADLLTTIPLTYTKILQY